MEPVLSDVGHAFWRQPSAGRRHFELRTGDRPGAPLATLAFRSAWGTLARAETGASAFTFKRVGFLDPRVTVRREGDPDDLALFRPRMLGDGLLTFRDGREYRWASTNFWATRWAFLDDKEQVLLAFAPAGGGLRELFKTEVELTVEPSFRAHPAAPLLAALGFYLVLLRQMDAAGAAAASP